MSQIKISASEVFMVMAIEKVVFNGMGNINPSDIKLIPVSGSENESSVYAHFHENMKHLKIIGVSSLEYLRFQEQILLDHLKENNLELNPVADKTLERT